MRAAALLGLAVLLAGCPSVPEPVADDDRVETALPDPVADPAFAFCHEAEADADQAAAWCPLLAELPAGTCPGLEATCASGRFEAEAGGCAGWQGGEGGGDYQLSPAPEATDPWRPRDGCGGEGCASPEVAGCGAAASWVDGALRWGLAILVAGVVVVLARVLLGAAGWLPAPTTPTRSPVEVDVQPEGIVGDDDLPALPEDVLLDQARAALDAGRLGDAVVLARGAALRRLARRGLLRLHRARTDREYLDGVAELAEVRAALGVVLGAVEALRWAGRGLTAERARDAVSAAGRIVAVALVALAIVPTAHAGRPFAPYGDAALRELLEARGYEPVDAVRRVADVDPSIDVVVLDLVVVQPAEEEWPALLDWVGDGGLLVVGGDPVGRVPGLGTHARYGAAVEHVQPGSWIRRAGIDPPVWPAGPTYWWCGSRGRPLALVPPGTPLLDDGARDCHAPTVVVATPVGLGWVVGIADPRVLRNAGLAAEANRRFLLAALRPPADEDAWELPHRPRVLLATSAAQAVRTPVQAVLSARLLPFVLQLCVFWVLLAAWRGWPMLPLRDPDGPDRSDLLDHVRALARHWELSDGARYAASVYAGLWWRRLGPDGLRAAAVRSGLAPAAADALVQRVDDLLHAPERRPDDDPFELMEALWQTTSRPIRAPR